MEMKLADLVKPYLFVPKARQYSFFSGAGFYSFTASSRLFFLLSFSSPFPFFLSPFVLFLAFSFLQSFQILSFILAPSSSLFTPPLFSLDCLHMKGFSRSELLSSLRHTNLSQTIAPHSPRLFFRPELGWGWGFGILRSLLEAEWKGGRKWRSDCILGKALAELLWLPNPEEWCLSEA